MLQSPFAFFKGAAIVMVEDLSHTPNSGINVQSCGDCHLFNFGGYATPERNQVFDINDFDETLPAPFEWDLKRLAASIYLAGRYKGFSEKVIRKSVFGNGEKCMGKKMRKYSARCISLRCGIADWTRNLFLKLFKNEEEFVDTDKKCCTISTS